MSWLDRNGGEAGKLGEPDYYSGASVSPDGHRILVTRVQPGVKRDLWLIDSQRGSPSRATFDPEGAVFGAVSMAAASVDALRSRRITSYTIVNLYCALLTCVVSP